MCVGWGGVGLIGSPWAPKQGPGGLSPDCVFVTDSACTRKDTGFTLSGSPFSCPSEMTANPGLSSS